MDINQPVKNQQSPIESQSSPTGQNQEPQSSGKLGCCRRGKKCWIIGIIVFVVIAGAAVAYIMFNSESNQPQEPAAQTPDTAVPESNQPAQLPNLSLEEDSTAAISQQLDDVTITDLDKEFKDIDDDLNQL